MIDFDSNTKIYICHFPGNTNILQEQIKKSIKQKFNVDKRISIVCAFNSDCLDKDGKIPLFNYLNKDINILYEEDLLEKEWKMEYKIPNILKSLKRCKTEYALITDIRDVIITADLDDDFINKFNSLDCDIVYNATTSKYPKINLQSDFLIEGGSKPFSYLNAGVCFGKTDKLIDWYEYCNVVFSNNRSEQFVIRKMYKPNFKIKIDGYRKLFRSCHSYDTLFFENKYLSYSKDTYINLDKKLKYKTLLPNNKVKKGKIKIEEMGDKRFYLETELKFINKNTISEINMSAKKLNVRNKTLILNYREKINNYDNLIYVLKIVDRLEINVYTSDGLKDFINRMNRYEFNCINKIIFNMLINDKFIEFPFNEKIEVNYDKQEVNSKKYKIIDKSHTGYYKIKLNKNELDQFLIKNKLYPISNYRKHEDNKVSILSKDFWKTT